jgi:hypothetical protein
MFNIAEEDAFSYMNATFANTTATFPETEIKNFRWGKLDFATFSWIMFSIFDGYY